MSTARPEQHDSPENRPRTDVREPPVAVRVEELTVELPSQERPYAAPLQAVRELDLTVPTGQITALVGAGGAGKTTALRTMIGALPWSRGKVEVLGTEMGPARVAVPEGASFVPDSPDYPDRWTARRLARAHGATTPFDQGRFDARLSAHGVPLDRPVGRLSRGQLTQLALSAALARDPRLLILDEPFARLDPLARTELVDELRDLMALGDRTILLSTHDLEGMERFVDRLVVIADGRTVLEGDVEALREELLLLERPRQASDERDTDPSLIGPTTSGDTTSALIAIDDAAGLPPGTVLRRPAVSELVTHCLRAAGASGHETAAPVTTPRRGAE